MKLKRLGRYQERETSLVTKRLIVIEKPCAIIDKIVTISNDFFVDEVASHHLLLSTFSVLLLLSLLLVVVVVFSNFV